MRRNPKSTENANTNTMSDTITDTRAGVWRDLETAKMREKRRNGDVRNTPKIERRSGDVKMMTPIRAGEKRKGRRARGVGVRTKTGKKVIPARP